MDAANAHGGGLWYAPTLGFCLAQDDSDASLSLGRALMQDASMPRFIDSLPASARQCLRSQKANSAKLCHLLLSSAPNPGPSNDELDKLYAKHKKQIERLLDPTCPDPK